MNFADQNTFMDGYSAMLQIPPVVQNAPIEMCDACSRRKLTGGCRQLSQLPYIRFAF